MLLKEVSAFMFITIACLSAEGIPECQPVTDVSFRQCLELSDEDIQYVPQPVVLTSSKDKFICAGQAPQFFFFSCILYGNEAVWLFNGKSVTSYHNSDNITQSATRKQLSDDPSYTLTTALELVEHETIYGTSRCISTLTVQPSYLNESQPSLPFNVTCLTTCQNMSLNATVCQHELYRVAERPTQPLNLRCTTNKTAVNLKWDPPQNQGEYELEYYTVTLAGREPHMLLCTSYDTVIEEEGSYTVHVTATNTCGNESEPSTAVNFTIVRSSDDISITDSPTITDITAAGSEITCSDTNRITSGEQAGFGILNACLLLALVSIITIMAANLFWQKI